jgi:hypothetical protein
LTWYGPIDAGPAGGVAFIGGLVALALVVVGGLLVRRSEQRRLGWVLVFVGIADLVTSFAMSLLVTWLVSTPQAT